MGRGREKKNDKFDDDAQASEATVGVRAVISFSWTDHTHMSMLSVAFHGIKSSTLFYKTGSPLVFARSHNIIVEGRRRKKKNLTTPPLDLSVSDPHHIAAGLAGGRSEHHVCRPT
jgi:hypothetical protein